MLWHVQQAQRPEPWYPGGQSQANTTGWPSDAYGNYTYQTTEATVQDDASASQEGGFAAEETEGITLELSDRMKQILTLGCKREKDKRKRRKLEWAAYHNAVPTDAEIRAREERVARHLYGSSASRLRAREADLNANFDRLCDTLQPAYFPVAPIRRAK